MNYQIPDIKYSHSFRKQFRNKYSACRYNGYYDTASSRRPLWEGFSDNLVISYDTALDLVNAMPSVYVMWEDSPVKLSRKLQKTQMISMPGSRLAQAIRESQYTEFPFTPADIYCISENMSCYVVFTRVYVPGIGNICLSSKRNIPETDIPASYSNIIGKIIKAMGN